MKVRQRNLDTRNEKQSLAAQRAQDDQEKAMKLKKDREHQSAVIKFNKDDQAQRNAREAERLK